MNVEEIRSYCITKKGVTETFPFDVHTLVFKVMDKMFALLSLERVPAQINLKCDPEWAIELREEYDGIVIPGYHMSKKHWNTIYIEQLDPAITKKMIDHSYELVVSKLSKKLQQELRDKVN